MRAIESTIQNRSVRRGFLARTTPVEALISQNPQREENNDRWNELITSRLVAWEYNSEITDDGDVIPPTPAAIAHALANARGWRDAGDPCPIDIIPDGDGGILFQCTKSNEGELSINVLSDGSVDRLRFVGGNLVEHEHFD